MNILVLYYSRTFPLRTTISDHLYSFERYSGARCFYVNVGLPWVPRWLSKIRFDAVVFHTILLWERVNPKQFQAALARADWVRNLDCPKVALPQDEHLHGDQLAWLIREYGVTHVMSCAQPEQWPALYPEVDRERVAFDTVLPGYLADHTLEVIESAVSRATARDIDIGYRAWKPWPSLGRHGLLKVEVGRAVKERAEKFGLKTDISNEVEDTILGDAWFDFLARCKYTVGVEGGASVLDYDGSVMRCSVAFAEEHPGASFDEVESACFPGRDGELEYFAISPRHLECCATRTCQVLIEGRYNGILEPGVHYLELKRDFSNLDDILEAVSDDDLREAIVERAYRDVVASGRWSYRSLVSQVMAAIGGAGSTAAEVSVAERLGLASIALKDKTLWPLWGFAHWVRRGLERIIGKEKVAGAVKRAKRRMGEVE